MNGKKPASGSDLRRADALPITPKQYAEIPELTEQWFEQAELHVGGVKVRGRPRSPTRKVPVKLRLDPYILKTFRKTGPGWQTKMNMTLRRAAKRLSSGASKRLSRRRRKPTARSRRVTRKRA